MIQTHGNSFKAQFSLATSKLNTHWQYQNPILIGNIKTQFSLALLYQKEKSPRLSTLDKEKYHVIVARKDHGNHLMKKLIESYLEDYVLIL